MTGKPRCILPMRGIPNVRRQGGETAPETALHQVAKDVVADSLGIMTPALEVFPEAMQVEFRWAFPAARVPFRSAVKEPWKPAVQSGQDMRPDEFGLGNAPTALLVAKTQCVFVVIIYLLKRGLSVPDTVSLIARDPDHIFRTVNPSIAYYHFGDDAVASRLSRLMLQMINQSYLTPEQNVIFPKYFPGGTVKQLD